MRISSVNNIAIIDKDPTLVIPGKKDKKGWRKRELIIHAKINTPPFCFILKIDASLNSRAQISTPIS